jgi:hypothetical protein
VTYSLFDSIGLLPGRLRGWLRRRAGNQRWKIGM